MPANATLTDVLAPYRAAIAAMAELLVPGWTDEHSSDALVRAAAGLAVAFSTWQTLAVEQGLTDFEAAALMVNLVQGAAGEGVVPGGMPVAAGRV